MIISKIYVLGAELTTSNYITIAPHPQITGAKKVRPFRNTREMEIEFIWFHGRCYVYVLMRVECQSNVEDIIKH